ncbi:hypothetical protein M0Q50_01800 [bacterium]|jgi:hypothetical protein|nr:hypothetical protein [bacterium]
MISINGNINIKQLSMITSKSINVDLTKLLHGKILLLTKLHMSKYEIDNLPYYEFEYLLNELESIEFVNDYKRKQRIKKLNSL